MPLLSLPVELHREVLLRLDHPSLLNMTSTNQYFRTVLKTLPVTAIQDSINDFLRSIEKPSSWNISDSWAMMGKFEKTNAGFLKTADMIPCYYYRAILPSEDFGDWATQRLTEIYDGAPLAGVCLYDDDDFHYRFHLIADQEFHPTARQKARGVSVRDMYDAVIDDNKSFLAVVDSIQCQEVWTNMGDVGSVTSEDDDHDGEDGDKADDQRKAGDDDKRDDEKAKNGDKSDDNYDEFEDWDNHPNVEDEVHEEALRMLHRSARRKREANQG